MKLKRNLFFLFTITIFGVASVILDIFNNNPYESGMDVFINLFISFFVALAGSLSLAIFLTRYLMHKQKTSTDFMPASIRQASLIALAATTLLILRVMRILDWWVGFPLVVAIILLELFFQTSPPTKKQKIS